MAKAASTKPAVKKATATASKKETRTVNVKYSDKSAGQPELMEIFEAIKKMAEPYHGRGAMVLHGGTGGQFNLVSHKAIEVEGRRKPEVWFVSALIQKGYVGFYYMPIYMNDPMKKNFSPEFIRCLKGKACFHIKKNDPAILHEINKAFEIGYASYLKRGWV